MEADDTISQAVTGWNPDAGCDIAPLAVNTTTVGSRVWTEVFNGAMALISAYGMLQGSGGQDYSEQLELIQDTLIDIRRSLDHVNQNLFQIMVLLRSLPLRIRGEIEDSAFRENLGAARSLASDIIWNSQPGQIDHNHAALDNALSRLNERLGAIEGVKGATGLLMSASLLSVWFTGNVALERSKMRTMPGYDPRSPWKHGTASYALGAFSGFATSVDELESHYLKSGIPTFPKYKKPLEKVTEGDGTVHLRFKSDFVKEGLLYMHCPTSGPGSERIDVFVRDFSGPGNPIHNLKLVRYEGPDVEQLIENRTRRKKEILSFFEYKAEWDAIKPKLLQSFVEPPDVWTST